MTNNSDEYQDGLKLPTEEYKWEFVVQNPHTKRLKVAGGYLYVMSGFEAITSCFVPEPDKCEYHGEYLMKCCNTCMKSEPYNNNEKTILTPEIKKYLGEELIQIQTQMYDLGKVDCLKSFKVAIKSMPIEAVNQVNVSALIDSILKELDK